jgi:hypothetical protein
MFFAVKNILVFKTGKKLKLNAYGNRKRKSEALKIIN